MNGPHGRILLDPANPHDFEAEDFADLVEDITADFPGVEVKPVERDEVGYGGPFVEVLHIWIDVADTVGAASVMAAVAQKVGRFMERRRAAKPDPQADLGPDRPRVANIYDGRGNLLKRVTVTGPGGPQDESPKPGEMAPHPKPRIS